MSDQTFEFGGIDRFERTAVHMCVNVRRKGNTERVMSVYADDASVLTDKLFELIGVANRYVHGCKFLEQKRFDNAQAVWNGDRLAIVL